MSRYGGFRVGKSRILNDWDSRKSPSSNIAAPASIMELDYSTAQGIWNLNSTIQFNKKPRLITDNLVLHLDAGNSLSYPRSGTAWNNLMATGNAVLVNAPTFNSGFGGYFNFNGTNQEVTTNTTVTSTSSPLTFFGWFRTSAASGKKIIGFQNNQTGTTSTNYDRHVYVNTSGKLVFGIYTGTNQAITSSASVNNGVWHSFAAVYNMSGNDELYVDGVSAGTINVTSTDTGTRYVRIAGHKLSGWTGAVDGYFPGDIAIMTLYNTALSANDVLTNHNATKTRFGV
jgi:hypothetical protein